MVLRAKIILSGAIGKSVLKTSKDLKCNRETLTRWHKHWVKRSNEFTVLEKQKEDPRPEPAPKFTAEQISKILATPLNESTFFAQKVDSFRF